MPARKLLSGFLATVLFAALPAAAKDIVWKQQTITIAKNPSRIAVYDPAALDILESLGVQTVAYNDGGQPDPAKLAAEPPELIILGGATAGRLKDTAAIAPSLDLTPDTDSYLTDLAARTMLLADIFGKNKAAEQKLKAVSNKRAILKQRTEGKTAVFLLMENGGFIPQSEDVRFGFFYTLSGLYTPDNADLTHHSEDRPPAPLPEKASSRQKKAAREAEEKRLAEQNARLENCWPPVPTTSPSSTHTPMHPPPAPNCKNTPYSAAIPPKPSSSILALGTASARGWTTPPACWTN